MDYCLHTLSSYIQEHHIYLWRDFGSNCMTTRLLQTLAP